ncbi:MAG: pentapeptide repeat-containing protein [Lachnospiraceae bacterium]|nr:pentapeptide repeat-containing protein [Lachnospiraceae bacterium]
MDRETALRDYQEAVSGRITEFQNTIGVYILEYAEPLEGIVRSAMNLMGEQMKKQGKESVSFLYFSFLKVDLLERKYRLMLHGLDTQWYLDEDPVEVYVDAGDLLHPLDALWNDLAEAGQGYGGAVNSYDIQNMVFDQMPVLDCAVSQVLRYRLREWEKKGIFESVVLSPSWLLKWGQYRDQTEMLIRTERVEKEEGVWNEELARARRKPDQMVFSYWYKGTYQDSSPRDLDMRFITFEESSIKKVDFQNCNMEGSRFVRCTLTDCTFEGCNLWGADFRGCRFEHTSFDGAELTAAVFPAESVPFLGISAEQLQVIGLDRGEEV